MRVEMLTSAYINVHYAVSTDCTIRPVTTKIPDKLTLIAKVVEDIKTTMAPSPTSG